MKRKDLIIVVASVVVSTIFSYIICSQFIVTAKSKLQNAEVVSPITADFKVPDNTIFNNESVNPTKVIEIGPNTNNQPFAKQ